MIPQAIIEYSRGGGMVDAKDLKSFILTSVRVRLPSSAPIDF